MRGCAGRYKRADRRPGAAVGWAFPLVLRKASFDEALMLPGATTT